MRGIRSYRLSWCIAFVVCTGGANAEESNGAKTGFAAWALFQCAYASSWIPGDTVKGDRWFDLAYESSFSFLEAYDAGQISAEDMTYEFPVRERAFLFGPNIPFKVGVMYILASENVEEIIGRGSPDETALRAELYLDQKNCNLLGQI